MKQGSDDHIAILDSSGYKCLGVGNNWKDSPIEIKECSGVDHKTNNLSFNPNGSDNVAWCEVCKYYYYYDSGD